MDSLREPFLPIIMNSFKRKKNNDIICLIELYWLIGFIYYLSCINFNAIFFTSYI